MDVKFSVYDVNLGLDVKQLTPDTFGKCVRRWRKKNGLSGRTVASWFGKSNTWIYGIEQGMNDRPYANNFIWFCYKLGFTVFDIELLLYRFGYDDVWFENPRYFHIVLWKGVIDGKEYEITVNLIWKWFKGSSLKSKYNFGQCVRIPDNMGNFHWK